MLTDDLESKSDGPAKPTDIAFLNDRFRLAIIATTAVGFPVFLIIATVCFLSPLEGTPTVGDMCIVALGSLLVAHGSMAPGLVFQRFEGGIHTAMVAGITIRLVGTVALFLTCRYQLASSAEFLAGTAIGWYVLLTSVEVVILGRRPPQQTSASQLSAPESASHSELGSRSEPGCGRSDL
ncbi:MAG: hypothetical protein AAGJ83_02570 [Planctomycetota bacterium]